MSLFFLEEEKRRLKKGGGGTPVTLNPLDKNSAVTLSNGNLTATGTNTSWASNVRITGAEKSSGVHTFEVYMAGAGINGLATAGQCPLALDINVNIVGKPLTNYHYYAGNFFYDTNANVGTTPAITRVYQGDYVGYKIDFDAGTITIYLNGVPHVANCPAENPSALFFTVRLGYEIVCNFGQSDFQYPILGAGLDGWFEE